MPPPGYEEPSGREGCGPAYYLPAEHPSNIAARERDMPPPQQKGRKRRTPPSRTPSEVRDSVEDQGDQSKQRKTIPRGPNLTEKECVILVNKCINRRDSYGVKDGATDFWNTVGLDFQIEVRREHPYKNVNQKMHDLVKKRGKEIEDQDVTGGTKREDDWTIAIDRWIREISVYDLEGENRRREMKKDVNRRAMQEKKKDDMMTTLSHRRELASFTQESDEEEEATTQRIATPASESNSTTTLEATPTPVTSTPVTPAADAELGEEAVPMTKRMSAREEKAKKHKAALDEIDRQKKELSQKKPKRDRAARVEDSNDDMAAMSTQMAKYNENARDLAERRLALDEKKEARDVAKEAREEAKEERLEEERLERQTSIADQSQSSSFDAINTRFDRLETMFLSAIGGKKTEEVKEESGAKEEIHQLN